MGKIIFILGGARSGKSTFAIDLTKRHKKVAFIATCQPLDKEMECRIRLHKNKRPAHWQTFEEPYDLVPLLEKINSKFEFLILDCLTLLLSNFLLEKKRKNNIEKNIRKMLLILKKAKSRSIIISNEVGLGIVPDNKLGRDFRDIAGGINQIVAKNADEVFFMVSGIPWKIK